MSESSPTPKFLNRELSWLEFNQRVLDEATDENLPLLERLKFLAIFVSNLDEFFMVRVSGIKNLLDSKYDRKDAFGYYPQDLMAEIKTRVDSLTEKLYDIHKMKLKKEFEKNKIFIRKFDELNDEQQKFIKRYFDSTLFPIITPMAIDQGRPFPVLPSKTLAFAVTLMRREQPHLAVIPVPKATPRLLKLPADKEENSFILIDEILRAHLPNFFRGYKILSQALFRVIRDSELTVDEEFTPDLLKAIEMEVKKRPKAKIMRLEIEKNCPAELLEPLCLGLDFPKENISVVDGDMDLTYLFELVNQVQTPELRDRGYIPPKISYENIFDKIQEGDFILHLPYQSFQPTVDMIHGAAHDPNVLAIKMTLYRTDEDSAIVKALVAAAKAKKQVTVLVEIKARFDEEKNIHWVKQLEEAGCHVVYGLAGMKIHSKITLIVRREEGKIRRYVHLSTGNYNEKTSLVYTDLGYFTCNDDFAKDISDVFNVVTGYSLPARWKRIISSPYDLREYFMELMDKEMEFHKKNKNGFIFAKMNSLEDPKMIEKLYAASNAGVKVKLLIRGICCLIPGMPGLSENIEVKSIVGRFLEHTRIFVFNNNSSPRVFLSSADWMRRNFDHRIELLFEISKEDIKEHILFVMDTCWKDNLKSRQLQADRTYVKKDPSGEKLNAQEFFIKHYAGS